MKLSTLFPPRVRAAWAAFHGATESGTRTSVWDFPFDSDKELPPQDRVTLVKKHRMLRNNFGLFKRMFEGTAQYSLGEGMIPSSATQDPEFNKRADEYFEKRAATKDFDVAGQHDFYSMQNVILQETACDGEVFALKVRGADGLPRMQLIKTHEVGSDKSTQPTFNDGIAYDLNRKPTAYNVVRKRVDGSIESTPYDALHMLHIYKRSRIGLRRGLPWGYTGVNSAIDQIDIWALAKVAFKVNTYFSGCITTPTGANPKGMTARIPGQTATANDGTSSRSYKNFWGGAAIPVFKEGEKFEFFGNKMPATNIAEMSELLVRDQAVGFGTHPEFFWSFAGIGGAPSRFVLEDASWFFATNQRFTVSDFCGPVREWILADGLYKGELRMGTDPNWSACRWQGPPKVTVDKQREGNLDISLVKNGLQTREEYWSARGKDALKMREKCIDEIAEDLAYCQLKKVPYALYAQSAPGTPGVDVPLLTQTVTE